MENEQDLLRETEGKLGQEHDRDQAWTGKGPQGGLSWGTESRLSSGTIGQDPHPALLTPSTFPPPHAKSPCVPQGRGIRS